MIARLKITMSHGLFAGKAINLPCAGHLTKEQMIERAKAAQELVGAGASITLLNESGQEVYRGKLHSEN
jgi:hypothetical protein